MIFKGNLSGRNKGLIMKFTRIEYKKMNLDKIISQA